MAYVDNWLTNLKKTLSSSGYEYINDFDVIQLIPASNILDFLNIYYNTQNIYE